MVTYGDNTYTMASTEECTDLANHYVVHLELIEYCMPTIITFFKKLLYKPKFNNNNDNNATRERNKENIR